MFKKIPILMYHSICNDKDYLSLQISKFEKQLRIIKKLGFQSVHFGENIEQIKKPLIITFDDGYEDVYLNALPLLRKFNLKATCFVVSNLIGQSNIWDENKKKFIKKKLMNFNQLQRWLNSNMRIGSHTLNHKNLTTISKENAQKEIFQSKEDLEKEFKIKVEAFSYPYGAYNNLIASYVKENYTYGVTTKRSRFNIKNHNLNLIPRVHINNSSHMIKFYLKINSPYEDLLYK